MEELAMSATRPRSDRPFVSLRWKLVIGFTLVFTVVFAGAYYWFYYFSTERALERIRVELQDTIRGAAAGLDGDSLVRLFEEGEVNAAGFSDHEEYIAQLRWFQTVQSLEPRAWPYTYVPGPEANQVYGLADLWSIHDPAKSYEFRELDVSSGPMIEGLRTVALNVPRDRRCRAARDAQEGALFAAVRAPVAYATCMLLRRVGYTDSYGSWVSAYAPVRTADGVTVGALGLDFEMAYVDEVQNAILDRTLHAFGITYLTLLLLVMFMSRVVTRPIDRLTAVAARVGEGAYDQDFTLLRSGRWRDEIGELAEVFQAMTEKIQQREQSLRREVRQLRVEIDEAKRAEAVQAIVETDFFRELQEKAQVMRARNARGVETGD
jgi:HAMP domain-containing protein